GDGQGIDEGGAVTLAVGVVGVDDEDRLADADLRGGQADAGAGGEGLVHVRDQFGEGVVELGDRLRTSVQYGLAVDGDGMSGHEAHRIGAPGERARVPGRAAAPPEPNPRPRGGPPPSAAETDGGRSRLLSGQTDRLRAFRSVRAKNPVE